MIEFEPLKIAELIGPLVAFVVGMGQIGMIWRGIAQMRLASEHRDQQHEENMTVLRALIGQQHEENMTALRALIERTAPKGTE